MSLTIERDREMETRDGVILRADIYRDAGSGDAQPLLLMRTPYDKTFVQLGIYPHPFWFVRQGYVVAIQDCRGRHNSDGHFEPFLYERDDGYDAVEWAASLPGINGRVGMYGASYAGATQLLAAVADPPSLCAVAPAVTSGNFYEDWFYEGGAFQLAFAAYWAAQLSEDLFRRNGADEKADEALAAMGDLAHWYGSAPPSELDPIKEVFFYQDWLSHPTFDDYWRERHANEDYGEVSAATLFTGGWFDTFLSGTLEAYRAMSTGQNVSPSSLVVGPWAHWPWGTDGAGALSFSDEAATLPLKAHMAFFARHLQELEISEEASSVRYFPIYGDGWESADTWPPKNTRRSDLYLHSEGLANRMWGDGKLTEDSPSDEEPADFYSYHGHNPIPSLGGHSLMADPTLGLMGPEERSAVEKWYEVLCYTSEPLTEQKCIAGPVQVELYVQSSAEQADYHAALSVVKEDGSIYYLADGIKRVALPNDGLESPPKRIEIDLRDIAAIIHPGERLRLDLAGGSFPAYDRNPQTGESPESAGAADMVGETHAVLHTADHSSKLSFHVIMQDSARSTPS